jgi:hypothetical protein
MSHKFSHIMFNDTPTLLLVTLNLMVDACCNGYNFAPRNGHSFALFSWLDIGRHIWKGAEVEPSFKYTIFSFPP